MISVDVDYYPHSTYDVFITVESAHGKTATTVVAMYNSLGEAKKHAKAIDEALKPMKGHR